MNPTRRQLLLASSLASLTPGFSFAVTPARPKILIVGGGWGGLSAASALATQADVVLIERNAAFVSLPLTNRWLAGLDDGRRMTQNYAAAARRFGYRFVQAEVGQIDRAARKVMTNGGQFAYDWLILAPGIAEDAGALVDGDRDAARHIEQQFSSTYQSGSGFPALKQKFENFSQGEFLITLPPAPYRCPPAPFERAIILAHAIKTRGLKAHLTVIASGAPWPAYQRVFNDEFRDQVSYLPNTPIRQLDPYRRVLTTDIDELKFDQAIIMPPQQAANLCRENGLLAPKTSFVTVNPKNFNIFDDERVFVIGDSVGQVSSLFGHFPKTGELASDMGRIAAAEIISRITGKEAPAMLPESTCFAYLSLQPAQFTRIESRYRWRGDGELTQSITQKRESNPRGEDDAWVDAMHARLFGAA